MSELFRNTLSPAQWALLAAVPPTILALYFLKLRRQPVEVPSTYLWMRAIEDLHVNSLWQRLRQSLLLLLQLLLVALAILALLRPGWQGTRLQGQRIIFVVDNSASMSATDVGDDVVNGQSRLEASKVKVAALIDQMERDMSAMIISFADSPRVVQEFTDNRRLLKERLETIEPTAASTDLDGALRLAGGVANPGQVIADEDLPPADVADSAPITLYMFTDGRFASVSDFSLGNLEPIYIPVGSSESGNLAITSFNTRRSERNTEQVEAFVQVANFTNKAQNLVVELTLDGEFLDARQTEAPANATASMTFPLADAPSGKLEAKIDAKSLATAGDALALDNNAYTGIDDIKPGAVLMVTPGNIVLETVLDTERIGLVGGIDIVRPAELEDEKLQAKMLAGDYDLVIFDRCAPASAELMPRCGALFVGNLPPTEAWISAAAEASPQEEGAQRVTNPQVIDWNRSHPLLAYVQVNDLQAADCLIAEPPQGGTELIESTAGPIVSMAPRGAFEDVVIGFPILVDIDGIPQTNTTWFKNRSFPTFWLNVLDYFVAGAGDPGRTATTPGATIELRPKGRINAVTVVRPDGDAEKLRRSGDGPFVYQETEQRGVYEVQVQEQVIQRFAVNLFDAAESDIRLKLTGKEEMDSQSLESIRIGYTDVSAQAGQAPARKELWRSLLLLAVVVLVFEWYIYNRRVYL